MRNFKHKRGGNGDKTPESINLDSEETHGSSHSIQSDDLQPSNIKINIPDFVVVWLFAATGTGLALLTLI